MCTCDIRVYHYKKLEVDLIPKKSSQLQSRFIQVVTHLLLPWFRVISLVQFVSKRWNFTFTQVLIVFIPYWNFEAVTYTVMKVGGGTDQGPAPEVTHLGPSSFCSDIIKLS